MKPIRTLWRNRYFRSRLEARWAVFFDTLGISYEYEKEGYDLGHGTLYLPDFWLTDLKFWVEIKPTKPTDEEFEKAYKLTSSSGLNLYMAIEPIGCINPWPEKSVHLHSYDYGDDPPEHLSFRGNDGMCDQDENYLWTICPQCKAVGIEFQGRSHRLCKCYAGDGKEGRSESRCVDLLNAYGRALKESFDRPWNPPQSKSLKPTGSLG